MEKTKPSQLTPALERFADGGASVAPSHVDRGHRAARTDRRYDGPTVLF